MKRTMIYGLIITAALALASIVATAEDKKANVLLQAGIARETVQGDLKGAIEIYDKAVKEAGANRALAAQALLRLGDAYQKLGDTKAQAAFQRIIQDFGDQKEAAEARSRLVKLGSSTATAPAQTARRIWANTGIAVAPPSADGRYLNYGDGDTDDIWVRDLKEGRNRRITNVKASGGQTAYSVISPDGAQVAYTWFANGGADLRILPVTNAESSKPRILVPANGETAWIQPHGWSADGKNLVALRRLDDQSNQIVSISIAEGSVRTLKSIGWVWPYRISFSPDGRYIAYDLPADGIPARDIFVMAIDGSRETPVAQSPADDNEPMWSPDGSQLLFVSDRSGKRALWGVSMERGVSRGAVALVTELPVSFYAVGMDRSGALYYGQNAIVRNIYTAELDEKLNVKGAPVRITDRAINANSFPALSPAGDYLAYESSRNDSRALVIRSVKTGDERELRMPMRIEGPPVWFPDGRSVLIPSTIPQKPRIGYYKVNVANGNAELLHDAPIPAANSRRPELSRDGKTIFHSEINEGMLGTKLLRFDIETGHETVLRTWESTTRGSARFVTSIAASPDGKQLAYIVSDNPARSASIELISISGGESREVFRSDSWLDDSRLAGLAWSPDQRQLFFAKPEKPEPNPQTTRVWRVPIAGGTPEDVGLSMNTIRFARIHPDGRRITFESYDPASRELWVLENFLSKRTAAR